MNETKETSKKITKAEAAKRWEAQKERDLELVTGIFEYKGKKGQTLEFRYGKYEEEGFPKYSLTDGKRYRIPRHVAKHLNTNCYYPEYKRLDAPNGMQTELQQADAGGKQDTHAKMYAVSKERRCEFKSLEFMDDDINNSEIIEVAFR